MHSFIMNKAQIALRKAAELSARYEMRRNSDLWAALEAYLKATKSTGCGLSDYKALYNHIRKYRPQEVLECGTGVSTLVIAHALKENGKETGNFGRVTSMEEYSEWLDMSEILLPDSYHDTVEFHQSDTIEDSFSIFRGVRYKDIPERNYDFVFVDGPKYVSPVDGTPTFDFDFIHVLRSSNAKVRGIVDKRVSTSFVLQQILGKKKVRYCPIVHLAFIGACTASDLGNLDQDLSSANFQKSLRGLGFASLSMSPVKLVQ